MISNKILLLCGLSLFSLAKISLFAATANATITYSISAIDTIALSGGSSGSPSPFNVTTAVAGSQPTSVTDVLTTLSVTTNSSVNRTLSAQIATAMPTGVTFTVNVAAGSSGGTSAGAVNVADGTSHNLVTGIKQIAASNMNITYIFSATVNTPVTSTTNVTLTYTLS